MDELNNKMKERWKARRSNNNNWKKLVIMVIVLIAIIWSINKLGNSPSITWKSSVETSDSLRADSTQTGQTP